MKVKELMAALESLNPELEVYAYCEDEFIDSSKAGFAFYSVDGVDKTKAILTRDSNRKPQIDFGDGESGRELAIVSLIADF